MKCPACDRQLVELVVGSLSVDACQCGCGGLWFDAFELQRVDEVAEPEGEILVAIRRDPAVSVDPDRKRQCPRCAGVKLLRHYFSPKRRVQVDECPNCGGYWLDAGELDAIRHEKQEMEHAEKTEKVTVSMEFVRYVYRLKTGKPR